MWSPAGRGGIPGLVSLLAMSLAGCGTPAGPASPPGGPAAGTPPPVEVRLVDHDGLLREVALHRGKVVVLDCWSTSCPPCVKEFPGLVALAARHQGKVACLSLAVEFDGVGTPEEFLPPVQAFLGQAGAGGITNLLASEEADALYRKLDLASVPAVYIWKPDGTLATRYDDDMAFRELGRAFTYADVEGTVAALLAE